MKIRICFREAAADVVLELEHGAEVAAQLVRGIHAAIVGAVDEAKAADKPSSVRAAWSLIELPNGLPAILDVSSVVAVFVEP